MGLKGLEMGVGLKVGHGELLDHCRQRHGPRIWKFARALDAVMPNLHLQLRSKVQN
jgi:hypothetical protein